MAEALPRPGTESPPSPGTIGPPTGPGPNGQYATCTIKSYNGCRQYCSHEVLTTHVGVPLYSYYSLKIPKVPPNTHTKEHSREMEIFEMWSRLQLQNKRGYKHNNYCWLYFNSFLFLKIFLVHIRCVTSYNNKHDCVQWALPKCRGVRGGRWTSLDASFARCFVIFWNIVKTSHR